QRPPPSETGLASRRGKLPGRRSRQQVVVGSGPVLVPAPLVPVGALLLAGPAAGQPALRRHGRLRRLDVLPPRRQRFLGRVEQRTPPPARAPHPPPAPLRVG